MNNNAIQTALSRVAALKAALGAAASKAGNFAKDELAGTLANLSPAAVASRYRATAAAPAEANDALLRSQGFPGGVAQFNQEHPPMDSGNSMLGDLVSGMVNAARKVKRKL